jgi:uncharacterized protein YqeY
MKIIDTIKHDSQLALKAQNSEFRQILNTILSDLQTDGKFPEQEEELDAITALVKKYQKAIGQGAKLEEYVYYLESNFLPKELTVEEIKSHIQTHNLTSIPEAIKYFKDNNLRVNNRLVVQSL